MTKKKFSSWTKRMEPDKERLKKLVKDIKANGYMYIKNNLTIEELVEYDPNVKAEWDIEEGCFTVYYKEESNSGEEVCNKA